MRKPKSERILPGAASTMRAAFDAISVWKCRMLISRVSTSCACGSGAVMRISGSLGKQTVPSGIACTSPVKRKARKIIEQIVAEAAGAFEPVDVGRRKAQRLEIVERVVEPGGEQKAAPRRQPPHEEFEHRLLVLAAVQIGLDHVEFVEVGGERAGQGRHQAGF